MKSPLDNRPQKTARINVAVDAEQKRRVYEAAIRKGLSPSQFIRDTMLKAASRVAA